MPEPAPLILFALAALALIAVPGPNLIYVATRSIGQGRRAGLVSVLGVETGTLVHVAARRCRPVGAARPPRRSRSPS